MMLMILLPLLPLSSVAVAVTSTVTDSVTAMLLSL